MAGKKENSIPHIDMVSDNPKRRLRLPVLNFFLVLLCSYILIVSTFIQIKIPHPILPADFLSNPMLNWKDFCCTYVLVPQIPALMFIVGLLGRKLSITSIILYIIIGLFFLPVFALGGGVGYMTEFGFGYILAYIPAVFLAGSVLKEKFSFANILKVAIIGPLTVHIIGILYMLIVALCRGESVEFIKGWILSQSMVKIVYDFIVSIFALIIAKYGNKYIKYLFND